MKKHLLIWMTFLLTLSTGQGQTQLTFQKTLGIGTGTSVQQTSDKGYVALGYAFGDLSGISLVKTDSLGLFEWSRYYYAQYEELLGYAVQQTIDGGFIITGNTP